MFIVTRRKKQKTWHEKSIFIFLPVFQEVFCPLVEMKVFFVELDTLVEKLLGNMSLAIQHQTPSSCLKYTQPISPGPL